MTDPELRVIRRGQAPPAYGRDPMTTDTIKYKVCASGRSRNCTSLEEALEHAKTMAADGWPTVIKNLTLNGKIIWRSDDEQTSRIRRHRGYGKEHIL